MDESGCSSLNLFQCVDIACQVRIPNSGGVLESWTYHSCHEPVTYCRPEPSCVVTDIPKRGSWSVLIQVSPILDGPTLVLCYLCCDICWSHNGQLCVVPSRFSVCAPGCKGSILWNNIQAVVLPWIDMLRCLYFLADSQVSSQESQHAICLFDCLIYMAVP